MVSDGLSTNVVGLFMGFDFFFGFFRRVLLKAVPVHAVVVGSWRRKNIK